MMQSGMIADIKQFKVLSPIVASVSVDVVNLFPFLKTSPNMLFHNEAMLKHVDTVSGELNVPIFSDKSPNI